MEFSFTLLAFISGLTLLLVGLLGLARHYNIKIQPPHISTNWLVFYHLTFKKLFQNQQRLFVLMSGLVLSLALVAGVSTHVDSVSQSVVANYFESDDRVSDIFVDVGDHSAAEVHDFMDQYQVELSWVKDYSLLQRWHASYVDNSTNPIWNQSSFRTDPSEEDPNSLDLPLYETAKSVNPILSVEDDFLNAFENQILLEEGNLTLGPSNVLVTGRWLASTFGPETNITKAPLEFQLFDWNHSAGGSMDVNWTSPRMSISGVISEQSPLLQYMFDLGYEQPGLQLFKNIGGIIMLKTADSYPSFWNSLQYQGDRLDCPECPSFETLLSVTADHTQIDQINPAGFLPKVDNFESDLLNYFSPDIELIKVNSPLRYVLYEYIRWTTVARASLILLSTPILFLGWFIADFTFKQVYRERRKEVSYLKSRGISNGQISGMIAVEAIVLVVVASILGFFLGVVANYLLEFLKFQGESSTIIDQMIYVVTGNPLQEAVFTLYISPLTPTITVGVGVLLVFLGAFRPIREIINWPIDEILQTEHEGKINEKSSEVNLAEIRNYLIIGIIGVVLLTSLGTLDTYTKTSNLVIGLAIIGLGMIFIGLINGMGLVARLLPAFIESVADYEVPHIPIVGILFSALIAIPKFFTRFFTRYAQWYVISREMKRHAKTTVAAFVVISLTLAFGIISSTLITTSADYYERDAILQIGVEGVHFTTLGGRENAFSEKYSAISDNFGNNSVVENVTSYYRTRSYFLPIQNTTEPNFPSLTFFNILFNFGGIDPATALFIDPNTYFDTAYLQDNFFVDDNINAVRDRMNKSLANYSPADNNYSLPIILDAETARKEKLGVGDTFYFAAARVRVLEGKGEIVGIAKTMPPGLTERFIVLPYYEKMWQTFSISNPTSGYLVKTNNLTSAENLRTEVLELRQTTFYGIESGILPKDYLANEVIALEMSTVTQILNLDFLFSIFLVGMGFLLILEFRTSQKSREIGTLKAVGMGNLGIIALVFVEALIIIVVAVVTGLFIGLLSGSSLTLLLPNLRVEKVVIIPEGLIILQIIIAVFFALLGSLIASTRANRHVISHIIK